MSEIQKNFCPSCGHPNYAGHAKSCSRSVSFQKPSLLKKAKVLTAVVLGGGIGATAIDHFRPNEKSGTITEQHEKATHDIGAIRAKIAKNKPIIRQIDTSPKIENENKFNQGEVLDFSALSLSPEEIKKSRVQEGPGSAKELLKEFGPKAFETYQELISKVKVEQEPESAYLYLDSDIVSFDMACIQESSVDGLGREKTVVSFYDQEGQKQDVSTFVGSGELGRKHTEEAILGDAELKILLGVRRYFLESQKNDSEDTG